MVPQKRETRAVQKRQSVAAVGRFLRAAGRTPPYYAPATAWLNDEAESLYHYRRIHAFLLNTFGAQGLAKKRITHLAAGNGQYVDFLKRSYGARSLAVDKTMAHLLVSQAKGQTPPAVIARAEELPLKNNSQDVIISDHFMLSAYQKVNHEQSLKRATFALKPGGLLIIERAVNPFGRKEVEFILKFAYELIASERAVQKKIGDDLSYDFLVFRKLRPSSQGIPHPKADAPAAKTRKRS